MSAASLAPWRTNIRADLCWNFHAALPGKSTRPERARPGSVELALPLQGPGAMRRQPFACAARRGEAVIPMTSLRFLADAAVASACLAETGHIPGTVSDGAPMLKHQVIPGRRPGLPPPLEALGIPDSAIDRLWVKDTAPMAKGAARVSPSFSGSGIVLRRSD